MSIRSDFKEVRAELNRLRMYGQQFHEYNVKDWPHLKNQEDFDRVYQLDDKFRTASEKLYGDGRDCAVAMSDYLTRFNEVGDFPTLTSYIKFLEPTWVKDGPSIEKFIKKTRTLFKTSGTSPWSIGQMLNLYEKQVGLLNAVQQTLTQLKDSNLYRKENNLPMNSPSKAAQITIQGDIQQFIGSIENSHVTNNLTSNVNKGDFGAIAELLSKMHVANEDIDALGVALKSDPTPKSAEELGPKTSTWLGGMIQKAASGTWKFSLSVASGVLSKIIAKYYGFE